MIHMSKLIYLKQFNNYFNRKVKFYSNLSDYPSGNDRVSFSDKNFNPNDGVSGGDVVNWTYKDVNDKLQVYDWEPDYCLVVEEVDGTDVIKSRWFVMEFVRTRAGQYSVTLRRDVIADNIRALSTSTAKIEKGVLQNANSPLIYNSEGVSVNRIKKSETLLPDKTGCPWLVAYIDKDYLHKSHENELTISNTAEIPEVTDIDVFNITDWKYTRSGNYTKCISKVVQTFIASDRQWHFPLGYSTVRYIFELDNHKDGIDFIRNKYAEAREDFVTIPETSLEKGIHDDPAILNGLAVVLIGYRDRYLQMVRNLLNEEVIINVNEVPKLVRTLDGKVYKINPKTHKSEEFLKGSYITNDNDSYMFSFFNDMWMAINQNRGHIGNDKSFFFRVFCEELEFEYEEVKEYQVTGNVEHTDHSDIATFDIICMPYGNVRETATVNSKKWIHLTSAEENKNIMDNIVRQLGGKCYDYQLLPYCPLNNEQIGDNSVSSDENYTIQFKGNGRYTETYPNLAPSITVRYETDYNMIQDCDVRVEIECGDIKIICVQQGTSLVSDSEWFDYGTVDYQNNEFEIVLNDVLPSSFTLRTTYITDESVIQNIVYVARKDTFSRKITHEIDISSLGRENLPETINKKLINDCALFRLCSPNYGSAFEFSPIKNGNLTSITEWNIDCTYKPATPFIHIAPEFGGLYGETFSETFNGTGDQRGLTCGGDYSVAMISDEWIKYQQSNKNYQAVFDRQIENMEVNHSLDMSKAWRNFAFGAVGGTVGGAVAGAKATGSPYGAIAGGVIGLGSSTIGSGIDISEKEQRFDESVKYSTDIHNLQLGNIQAMPNTLTRTDAFVATNRYIPFIEIYDCTDEEKDAYINMITYSGMSVGVIDILGKWMHNNGDYIKAQLIRTDIVGDNHMIGAVAYELNSGLYIEEIK